MRAKNSLYWHFLSIIIPFVVIVFIAMVGVYEWLNYNQGRGLLLNKLDDITSNYPLLLSEATASKDTAELEHYLGVLIADPDVAFVIIKDDQSSVLVRHGEIDAAETSLQRSVAINVAKNDAPGEEIKKTAVFSIGLSTQSIINDFFDHLIYESILLLVLIATILFAVRLAYVEMIGNPLDALIHSFDYFKKYGKHQHVEYKSNNELGAVIKRLNDMQANQLEIQQQLNNQYFSLERIVSERTQALEDELSKHAVTTSKLYNEKQRAQITLNSISDSVITADNSGVIEFMNPAACKLASYKKGQAEGRYFSDVFHLLSIESRDPVLDLVPWCLQSENKRCPAVEFFLKIDSGKEYIVEVMMAGLLDVKGKANGVVVLIRDITAFKNRNKELSYLAQHDMLTGLVNRREFESRMQRLLEDARLNERQHVLFYLDLDHFKIVNDECGHAAGDKVLKLLSEEFKNHLRKDDCIGRLGGDEFGVLLVNCNVKSAQIVGEKMRQDIDKFRFDWHGKTYSLGVSIGIVAITQHAESIESLMAKADASCYTAKQNGRNQMQVYTENQE